MKLAGGGGRRSPSRNRSGDGGGVGFGAGIGVLGSRGSGMVVANLPGDGAMQLDDGASLHGGVHVASSKGLKTTGVSSLGESMEVGDNLKMQSELLWGDEPATDIAMRDDEDLHIDENLYMEGRSKNPRLVKIPRTQLCPHDVCVNNPEKVSTQNRMEAKQVISNRAVEQTTNVWQRPLVVSMPSMEELGGSMMSNNVVQLDAEAVNDNIKKFDGALVGRLFGRRFPFHYLSSELRRRWDKFGLFHLVTISAECFICFFDNVASRDAVLMGGPWVIAGQVLGLDKWSSSFSPTSAEGFNTPVWVHLPGLPLYCWDVKNIARITSPLGEPLWLDAATDRWERGGYARACVKIDLSKPLMTGVWVQGLHGQFFQLIEYEGLSTLCFRCGCVGHKENACTALVDILGRARTDVNLQKVVTNKNNPNGVPNLAVGHAGMGGQNTEHAETVISQDPQTADGHVHSNLLECPDSTRGLGPWMVVTRRRKQQVGKQKPPNARKDVGPRTKPSWETNINLMEEVVAREQSQHITGSPVHPETGEDGRANMDKVEGDETTNGGSRERAATVLSPPGKGTSPGRDGRNPKAKQGHGGLKASSRDRLSKAYIKRLMKSLGPVAHGSRKTRKQIKQLVGGDASSRYNQ